jgi:hypothetical protein
MSKQTACTAFLNNEARLCGKPAVEGKTKCRGHGGLSSGPKTDAGKQRAVQAHWVHGRETRTLRIQRSQICHDLRQLEEQMYAEVLIHGPRTRGRKPSLWRQAVS